MTYHCAVIGNPIAHSRSPEIHAVFARERGIALRYDRILATPDTFADTVSHFFAAGGRGLNITLPFKETAYQLCGQTTPYATAAAAVNTLWLENGILCGDNTDGRGLRQALEQEYAFPLTHKRILILGAGGAARGVILPLCEARPALLHIANRTLAKAEQIVTTQQPHTTVPLRAFALSDLSDLEPYDIIINATSAGLHNDSFSLPHHLATANALAYDMIYGKDTPFLHWAKQQHLTTHDGYSMLLAQARLSFQKWFPQ
ncbi:MAG: shikimate dehydrogenase [Cardiobacteriaceae bacterium]|nr:shikimate dehydrogenase [Cardiobacteriaceae bacterium]